MHIELIVKKITCCGKKGKEKQRKQKKKTTAQSRD
jgi:hypothetical protein